MANSFYKVPQIKLHYQNRVPTSRRPLIANGNDVYPILIENWDMNRIELLEEFKILLLNRGNRCIGISDISVGGSTACIVDPKQIFMVALKANACQIILAHNHPSGSLKPSNADIQITKKVLAGGSLLDIEVLDHLIVTKDGFYSFASEGLMP